MPSVVVPWQPQPGCSSSPPYSLTQSLLYTMLAVSKTARQSTGSQGSCAKSTQCKSIRRKSKSNEGRSKTLPPVLRREGRMRRRSSRSRRCLACSGKWQLLTWQLLQLLAALLRHTKVDLLRFTSSPFALFPFFSLSQSLSSFLSLFPAATKLFFLAVASRTRFVLIHFPPPSPGCCFSCSMLLEHT